MGLAHGRGNGFSVLGMDLRRAAARIIINAIAIIIAARVVDGIHEGGLTGALLAGAIFGVVNAFIKPVLQALTCPLYLLTLGLFALVVNGLMLALTAWIAQQFGIGFEIDNFGAAVLGALVVTVVSWAVSLVL